MDCGGGLLIVTLMQSMPVVYRRVHTLTRHMLLPAHTRCLSASSAHRVAQPTSGLSPDAFEPFKLKEKSVYNHNTTLFKFALKDEDATPELPVSSCVMTSCKDADGKDVIRPYTPINQADKGVLNLLIKVYPNGKMSQHIHGLNIGDELLIKGPMKKKPYAPNTLSNIALIAGGTGQRTVDASQ